LLNKSWPDAASARAVPSGTAGTESSISNAEQAGPTIAIRGMQASAACAPAYSTRRADHLFRRVRDRGIDPKTPPQSVR
jgi:hypothetical protein